MPRAIQPEASTALAERASSDRTQSISSASQLPVVTEWRREPVAPLAATEVYRWPAARPPEQQKGRTAAQEVQRKPSSSGPPSAQLRPLERADAQRPPLAVTEDTQHAAEHQPLQQEAPVDDAIAPAETGPADEDAASPETADDSDAYGLWADFAARRAAAATLDARGPGERRSGAGDAAVAAPASQPSPTQTELLMSAPSINNVADRPEPASAEADSPSAAAAADEASPTEAAEAADSTDAGGESTATEGAEEDRAPAAAAETASAEGEHAHPDAAVTEAAVPAEDVAASGAEPAEEQATAMEVVEQPEVAESVAPEAAQETSPVEGSRTARPAAEAAAAAYPRALYPAGAAKEAATVQVDDVPTPATTAPEIAPAESVETGRSAAAEAAGAGVAEPSSPAAPAIEAAPEEDPVASDAAVDADEIHCSG